MLLTDQKFRLFIIFVSIIIFLLLIFTYNNVSNYKVIFIQRGSFADLHITNQIYTDILNFHFNIKKSERTVFSQLGQDGVLDFLTHFIGMNGTGTFVEFGVQSGVQCTTRYLRQIRNWTGIMFDGGYANKNISLYKEYIHPSTIVELFKNYSIPQYFDLLVEDTDYADYWIVKNIMQFFRPKLVVHEVNQQPPDRCVTIPYSDKILWWNGDSFHGGSVDAFYCLAKLHGYTMVYCEIRGVDCFWVRNDILEQSLKIDVELVQFVLRPKLLYASYRPHYHDRPNANWTHVPTCLN